MEPSLADIESKVRAFQTDLVRPSEEIVHKHILTGSPVALSADEYFTLRHEVAIHFSVHPAEVGVVGYPSGHRTGTNFIKLTMAAPGHSAEDAMPNKRQPGHWSPKKREQSMSTQVAASPAEKPGRSTTLRGLPRR